MNLAPVILAAGASRRLGEPKALADLGGRSVLERLSGALRSDASSVEVAVLFSLPYTAALFSYYFACRLPVSIR